MNDERQRLLAMKLDPVNGVKNISRYQGPAFTFRVNHLSGVVEQIPAVSGGVDWFQERNSQPQVQSLNTTNELDFTQGGPAAAGSVQQLRSKPVIPQGSLGMGIDFVAMDPVEQKRPGADRRDARGSGPALFG